MDFIINLLAFVFALGIIVSIHELGHLIFAKRAGMLCFEYSIGLGPAIYQRKGKETDFSVRAIPIGGYVSIAGESMSTEMVKKDQVIGLNLVDGKVKEMILFEEPSELKIQITDFEIYSEHGEPLFIEGYVDGVIKRFDILEDAIYKLPKQNLKIAPYKVCFESKTYIEKLLTLIAGPMMNFLLALFLFFVVASFKGAPVNQNKIGSLTEENPAFIYGLRKGDVITSINGNEVNNWEDIGNNIKGDELYSITIEGSNTPIEVVPRIDITQLGISNYHKKSDGSILVTSGTLNVGTYYGVTENSLMHGDTITKIEYKNNVIIINRYQDLIDNMNLFDGGEATVTYLRNGEEKTTKINVWERQVLKSQGIEPFNVYIGISPTYKYNFVYSLKAPFVEIYNSFYQVLMVLKFLFGGSKQIGVGQLSGPVGIFNIVGQIARQGFLSLLTFVAFLSVNIGILNLLPIPALDGGRILFISIEGITRKRIPRKTENLVNNLFFFLLMLLFVYVTFNDILRLF